VIRPGQRRCYGQLQSPTESQDSTTGEVSLSWSTVRNCWASIQPVSGAEEWRGQRLTPETTHLLGFEYIANVDSTYRFVYGGANYQFLNVRDPDMRHRELAVDAKVTE
jgi:SPP1 family predicted phage head-tail adaptor